MSFLTISIIPLKGEKNILKRLLMVLLAVWKACVNRNTQNILLLTETFECGFLRDLDILLKNKRKEKKRKKEIKEKKKIK